MYDPEAGIFISQDSIDFLVPNHLTGLNLFAYCNNNPVMYSDSNGNSPLISFVAYTFCAVASLWDTSIRDSMNKINWNIFNTDENAVLESEHISFYKGSFVVKFNSENISSFAFLGMIHLNDDQQTSQHLNHEQGHNVQEFILGTPLYSLMVALPSLIYCAFGDYNNYGDAESEKSIIRKFGKGQPTF